MLEPVHRVPLISCRNGTIAQAGRLIPEETAVSLVYNGGSYAVMMASPADLQDFAIGFSLTEGIIETAADITDLQIVEHDNGIEIRMWLAMHRATVLASRRRAMAGPTGCGLCGLDSLQEAMREGRPVAAGGEVAAKDVPVALAALSAAQALNRQTRAVHAAALWKKGAGLIALREDVGRHNALDKLVGALRRSEAASQDGVLLLTSRVSIEMVQKACVLGTSILLAVSAPTALAVRMAHAAGLTLIGIARDDGFEVFTHPYRLGMESLPDVA